LADDGDALRSESFSQLLGGEVAGMLFTDPPYNVPIDGHASGLGTIKGNPHDGRDGDTLPQTYRILKSPAS
jgi:hypothetical protein